MTAGRARGRRLAVAYIATSTSFAYAIATRRTGDIAPGTILWRTQLAAHPCGNGQFGNFSMPIIDPPSRRLYVESCDRDREEKVHALDLGSGRALAGWPVALNAAAIDTPGLNRNGARLGPTFRIFSAARSICAPTAGASMWRSGSIPAGGW